MRPILISWSTLADAYVNTQTVGSNDPRRDMQDGTRDDTQDGMFSVQLMNCDTYCVWRVFSAAFGFAITQEAGKQTMMGKVVVMVVAPTTSIFIARCVQEPLRSSIFLELCLLTRCTRLPRWTFE